MAIGNGNSEHSELKDIEYDPDDPIYVNSCNSHPSKHTQDCDLTCERIVLTEVQVGILNEMRAWARAGMNTNMIRLDPLEMRISLLLMRDILMDRFEISAEEFQQAYLEKKLSFYKEIRIENEEAVKMSKIKDVLKLGDKRLYGPNGQQL